MSHAAGDPAAIALRFLAPNTPNVRCPFGAMEMALYKIRTRINPGAYGSSFESKPIPILDRFDPEIHISCTADVDVRAPFSSYNATSVVPISTFP